MSTQSPLSPDVTLAELATHYPAASRVLHEAGLDYCCGGRRSVADACAKAGVEVEPLLDKIAAEIETGSAGAEARWSERPLPELIDRIVTHYHPRLRNELPQLIALADKVERRHADKASVPRGLAAHLRQIQESVSLHMMKEEQVLFPAIMAGHGKQAGPPIQMMEHEHDDHGRDLARSRELTNSYQPPPEACTSWRALFLRLAELEAELMEHIHLENNVLFPRALCE